MTNDPIIKIEQLEKSFGDLHVLKGIDLEVNRGEVVCIIGASGSGKSTLLRCINLLEEADSGHIWFDGQDLMDLKVNLNALLFQIGAGRHAFAANDHVAIGVLAHGLLLLHLVQGHSPLERHGQLVRTLVAQNAVEIAQHRLPLHGLGNEGNVFNGHYPCPPFSMWCMNCSSDIAIPMEAKHSRASCWFCSGVS